MSVQEQEAGTADQVTVNAGQLRHTLSVLVHEPVSIGQEPGGWYVAFDGQPLAAEGDSLDAAVEDMIHVLRAYADIWDDLAEAPDHQENWGLAHLVALSSDDQLRTWLQD